MAKEATRERKIKFINSFGRDALEKRLVWMLYEHGTDFLTDEQVNAMTERHVEDAMATNRRCIRNRRNINNRARMAALEEVA